MHHEHVTLGCPQTVFPFQSYTNQYHNLTRQFDHDGDCALVQAAETPEQQLLPRNKTLSRGDPVLAIGTYF